MLKQEDVMHALKTVYDPELGIDIVSLGIVHGVDLAEDDAVRVLLTPPTPARSLGEQVLSDVEDAVRVFAEAPYVEVELVSEPAWTPACMTDDARARARVRRTAPEHHLAG